MVIIGGVSQLIFLNETSIQATYALIDKDSQAVRVIPGMDTYRIDCKMLVHVKHDNGFVNCYKGNWYVTRLPEDVWDKDKDIHNLYLPKL